MNPIRTLARKTVKLSIAAVKAVTGFDDLIKSEDSFTYQQLDDLLKQGGLSKLLLYRKYREIEDGIGIYTMADKCRGFMFQITPPAYLGENTEKRFRNLISTIAKEGYVVQIITYASENLEKEIQAFRDLHHCESNIREKDMLKDWVNNRAKNYEKWTRESMMQHTDVRLRNFITIVSVKMPYKSTNADIVDSYNTAMEILKPFNAKNYSADELTLLYDELFRPTKRKWNATYDPNVDLNNSMGLNTIINFSQQDQESGTVTIDKTRKMQALTTAKTPKYITLTGFQQLFYDVFGDEVKIPTPSPYLISMTISAKNIDKTAESAKEDAVHNKDQLRKLGAKDIDQHPHFGDRYQECDDTIYAVSEKGERLYKTMLQFFVFEDDPAKLDRSCKALIERFKLSDNGGWFLEKEKHSLFNLMTFLYSLPLMHLDYMEKTHLEPRFNKRWTSNNASTAPVVADAKGFGQYRIVTVGRSGQIQRIDWRAGSNQNIIIIGPMGTGKSFLINEIAISSLSQGAKIRSFDLGRSTKEVCVNNGGKHIEFQKNANLCMNFFTNLATEKREFYNEDLDKVVEETCIHTEELVTLIPLVGLMCKQDLKSSYSENPIADGVRQVMSVYVQRAIEITFSRRQHAAGMREVLEVLNEFHAKAEQKGYNKEILGQITTSLYNYGHPNGMFYSYMNGPNTIEFSDNDLAVFEFEELKNMGDLLYVAQAAIMQKIATEFFYLPRELPKMFGIDEAKILALDNKVMLSYIDDFTLRLRKYKADFYIATQSTSHFASQEAKSMFDLAAWKIFLQRDDASIENDIRSGMLTLNQFEKRLMSSLQYSPPDFSEFFLLRGNSSMVCRLKVDSFSYWLYTTSPEDVGLINDTMKSKGYTRREAITYLASMSEKNSPEVSALAVDKLRLRQS